MNRKQLAVLALVVGLLSLVWLQGHRWYVFHHRLTVEWVIDQAQANSPHPSPRPDSYAVEATIGCMGPLDPPDQILDVRSPGFAAVGTSPWQATYREPNPCIAERSGRRQTLAVEAGAIFVLGILLLVIMRNRRSKPQTEDVLASSAPDTPAD